MSEVNFHEVADIFPMMEEAELNKLAADIAANGLLHPITTYEDKILDGRNRYLACQRASAVPQFEQFKGNDPLAFVISANLKRRHLSESQRAMVAARLANMQEGRPPKTTATAVVSQNDAGMLLNVSPDSIQRAKSILESGTLELIKAVDENRITVNAAKQIVNAPPETQKQVVAKVEAGIRPQEAMRQVLAESYKAPLELPGQKKYRVIYADPPWAYSNTQVDGFKEQRDHYPVMNIAEICSLPIKDILEDNAVLFLWVTSPILREVFDVIDAWGFTYKASFVWDKVGHVMGHYNSVRHEFLLICVRGSCQPDVRTLFDSVVTEERTEHSVKPETFRKIIETLYLYGNKLELFGRKRVPGWDAYGNEFNGTDISAQQTS